VRQNVITGEYCLTRSCSPVEIFQHFWKKDFIHPQGDTLQQEAVQTSETSANFNRLQQQNTPEDSNLHNQQCENLMPCPISYTLKDILKTVKLSYNTSGWGGREKIQQIQLTKQENALKG
jgi:hypothetical protein